jgi:K+-sensing histidine kinase KdpD
MPARRLTSDATGQGARLPRWCRSRSSGDGEVATVGLWYRAHPCAAVAVCAALFVTVGLLEGADHRSGDAIALLYVLPIALAAVAFGLRGGLAAAVAGYAVFACFSVAVSGATVTFDGWITRAAAMFLLGGLLGHATDQATLASERALQHQQDRLTLEEQNRRYSEGLELSDSIVQHMAAAKWMVEQGRTGEAAEVLEAAIDRGQKMVGDLLPARATVPPITQKRAGERRTSPLAS